MTRRQPPCDDRPLAMLLDGDQSSGEFRELARHVDSCQRCQQRLTELSGGAEHWAEQRAMLRPLAEGDTSTGGPSRARLSEGFAPRHSALDEALVKSLLAEPTHPEMLGRLGRYEIERLIGAGGMGVVLKGFDSELNRPVAIKLLAPHLARVGAARQRFAREARAAAAVVHEHVVAIHNVESDHATPFLVMQFVPGESLQARVDREGPLSVKEVLRIGMQAACGLAAAHAQGLIHRDVKPANILLESGVERAYLTDFGLARASDDAGLTHTGVLAGTPHYMSPEQADGRALDPRSDLFSFGSVLYFMATGHPPFRADGPMAVLKRTCHDPHRPARQCNAEIPPGLSSTIDRLLAKDPARRLASAAQLQHELAAMLADVQRGLPVRRARRWTGSRGRWVSGAVVALLLVGAAVGSLLSGRIRPAGGDAEPRQSADLAAPAPPAATALDQLRKVDPSPAQQSQDELDQLFRELGNLESAPFPEAQQLVPSRSSIPGVSR